MKRSLVETLLFVLLCTTEVWAMDAHGSRSPAPPPRLESPAFKEGGPIPRRFTCEGKDLSVPLSWSGLPPGTKSVALIMDDPDAPDPKAPKMTWVHWVVYDLPPRDTTLGEGASLLGMPEGCHAGTNDWKRTGYGGPCPPIGRHRYRHKIYALDVRLGDRGPLTKKALLKAIEGHVLARSVLTGTYEKQKAP